MSTVSSSSPRNNPLLRDTENVSPALSLDLVVGYDADGWDIRQSFWVGQLVVSLSGRMYRVIGFSLSNTVFVAPHGLGHDRGVSSVEFRAEGLRNVPDETVEVLTHKRGLVTFG